MSGIPLGPGSGYDKQWPEDMCLFVSINICRRHVCPRHSTHTAPMLLPQRSVHANMMLITNLSRSGFAACRQDFVERDGFSTACLCTGMITGFVSEGARGLG